MENILYSILLTLIGLSFGIIIMLIINKLKLIKSQKDADKLIENAKKELENGKTMDMNYLKLYSGI